MGYTASMDAQPEQSTGISATEILWIAERQRTASELRDIRQLLNLLSCIFIFIAGSFLHPLDIPFLLVFAIGGCVGQWTVRTGRFWRR